MYPVVILAGGLATRLRPLTESVPKALIEVANTPFISWQLNYLRFQGVSSVLICLGYLGSMIEEFIGNGAGYGLDIQYSYEDKQLLGTGGAINQALHLLPEDFFILYGDSFLPINFNDVQKCYIDNRRMGLMTVLKNQNQWDKSNVIFSNNEIVKYDKKNLDDQMHYIDYGLGILNKQVFASYENGAAFDLADIYHNLSIANQLTGFEVFERFYEIGSHTGLAETEEYFLNKGESWNTQNSI
jgi:MurNAc alpha-1-phosphate uridylyltransferase